MKAEQENCLELQNFIKNKKKILEEQEEFILVEKRKIEIEKESLNENQKSIQRMANLLKQEYDELTQTKNKISVTARIIRCAHKNSKSEGKNYNCVNSPLSRAKSNGEVPDSILNL